MEKWEIKCRVCGKLLMIQEVSHPLARREEAVCGPKKTGGATKCMVTDAKRQMALKSMASSKSN